VRTYEKPTQKDGLIMVKNFNSVNSSCSAPLKKSVLSIAKNDLLSACGLPCLYSNNSIIDKQTDPSQTLETTVSALISDTVNLSTQQKKSATALAWNVEALAQKFGIHRLGFLTLTFEKNGSEFLTDGHEAQRRFNSLVTNVLRDRYPERIRVRERHKNGAIHYHLIIVLPEDIRTGFDFDGISKRDYSSASAYLKAEWAFLRRTMKAYGFGRSELLPIKSTAEGVSRYVGKYLSKNVQNRVEGDKGFRLVEYSRQARAVSTRFNFNTHGSRLWRFKLHSFQLVISHLKGYNVPFDQFKEVLGSSWAYRNRDFIFNLPIFSQNYAADSLTAPIDFSVSSSSSPLKHVIDVLLSRSLPPDIIETDVFNRYQNFKSTFKQKSPIISGL